jgi:amidase
LLTVELCVSRSVRDTATVLDAVSKPFVGDPVIAPAPSRPFAGEVGADAGTLRIGLLTDNLLDSGAIDADCVTAAERAAQLLESLGHHVEREYPKAIADPALVDKFTVLWWSGLLAEMRMWEQVVGKQMTERDVEPLTWTLAQLAAATSAVDLLDAYATVNDYSRAVQSWWDDHDLLLTPTLGEVPVPLGTFQTPDEPILGFARAATFVPFTPEFNVTGQPAISLPLHVNAQGLPIGVQLVAAYGREDVLLRVASQLEQAQPWADRRPAVHASTR